MKAIEFSTKIIDDQILIPQNYKPVIYSNKDKDIRVIVLFEESDEYEESAFMTMAKEEFFNGYSESDSIYDSN
jgi:hypothetical protein